MLTLGIETSCDETGVALVRDGALAAHELVSQADLHSLFGGVVPEIASREHLRALPLLFNRAMQRAGVGPADLDAVAVARGPGLLGSLLVGLSFAKGLSLTSGARLVGVNHLHAHLTAPGLETELVFPALGVLVSGGHTHLYLMRSPVDFEPLGRTLDDAAGEAFDKSAKSLNLPYPGGRLIDELGRGVPPDRTLLPRPYLDNDNLNFSFSGLKTAVVNHVAAHPELKPARLPQSETPLAGELAEQGVDVDSLRVFCSSLCQAVADTLRVKAGRALDRHRDVRSLIVAGGVAANSRVRAEMSELARKRGLEPVLPSPGLCTDNGSMIAWHGELLARAGLYHGLDLEAVARGRAVPRDFLCGKS